MIHPKNLDTTLFKIDVTLIKENEPELEKRTLKISENPSFRDDINFIKEQLELIKKQRDIYKALLSQYNEAGNPDFAAPLRSHSLADLNNPIIDPYSPSYGLALGDRIDQLNFQIKNIMEAVEDKSIKESPLRNPSDNLASLISLYSPSKLRLKQKPEKKAVIFKKSKSLENREKNQTREQLNEDLKMSESFDEDRKPTIARKPSFSMLKSTLDFFPQRIKQLEKENQELEKLLKKMHQRYPSRGSFGNCEMSRSVNRKGTLDMRKELENMKKELDQKKDELDRKEKELNMREMKMRSRKSKKKESKTTEIKNEITTVVKNSIHYENDDLLKGIREKEAKKKNEEQTEKNYACKACRVF